LFGEEARYIRSGITAKVSMPTRPGTTFRATVSEALSSFDSESRTLKVRLDAANPDLILRPGMFLDVEFPITLPPAISVPAEAILESGLGRIVFVDRGKGVFEPRRVETGWRFGDRVQIVRGLNTGETIVVSGNFLLDSESRMQQGDLRPHH
jgi:Cu(I)/Ag(I) efflux system membrane fusion protein